MASTLQYTTRTDGFVYAARNALMDSLGFGAPKVEDYYEDFCFICSRATDHAGEHGDVVEVSTYYVTEEFDATANIIRRWHASYTRQAEGPITEEAFNYYGS